MKYTVSTEDEYIICPECKGEATVYVEYNGSEDIYKKCTYCNGKRLVRRFITTIDQSIE
jgi:excinuclease UvrABC ATPase subunit